MVEDRQPLISIIVPVYQVEAYISECVESLLAQTYTNLEILLVDDGSTDGSGGICDEYACRDRRIRVVHQVNQGVSAARNRGLDQAAGEYVAFVDSDDAVMPDFIEILYDLIGRYRADIAACAFVRGEMEKIRHPRAVMGEYADKNYVDSITLTCDAKRGEGIEDGSGNTGEVCMTSEQMLRQWHGKYKKLETIVCNKLYRKSILGGKGNAAKVRFPIGRRYEDVLTSHLMIANAYKIALTPQHLYLYRTRQDSFTTQTMTAEQREQNLLAQRERMAFFKEKRYWRAYLNLLAGYVLHVGWFGWMRVRGWK